jgi:hypothetical protein
MKTLDNFKYCSDCRVGISVLASPLMTRLAVSEQFSGSQTALRTIVRVIGSDQRRKRVSVRIFGISVFIEGSKNFTKLQKCKTIGLIEKVPICTGKEYAELKHLTVFFFRNTYPTIDETPPSLQNVYGIK